MNEDANIYIMSEMMQDSKYKFDYKDQVNLISTSFIDDTDIDNSDTDIIDEDFFNEEHQHLVQNTFKMDATSQTNCQRMRTENKTLNFRIGRPKLKEMKTVEYSPPVTVWLYSLYCTPEEELLECKQLPHSPLLCSERIQQNINNIQYRASTVSTVFAMLAR